jgi:myo-inositol-1-phosphate synthase
MAASRIGIWFIGAKGGIATTTAVGLAALKKQLMDTSGLVSALPEFAPLELAGFDQFVLGGHEIRDLTLSDEALRLASERAIDASTVAAVREDLEEIDRDIRPGTLVNVGQVIEQLAGEDAKGIGKETPMAAVERVQADLKEFAKRRELDEVIVVNIASTEPPFDGAGLPETWPELEKLLHKQGECKLPASALYAIAALDLGHPYINFTPSVGSGLPAICDLALRRETCHMGHDGKTGETLLKSVLAPMFAKRNLQVMSWVGHNIFGNMDGVVLDDPANKATKVTSKDRLLGQIFGYTPQTLVTIEYIKSLGDWKTAWDHIHFRGFLGTPMILQFTWQGCDSLLAAPLVLDLVRFAERARRAGDTGLLTFLASFFKSPLGTEENDFHRQFQELEAWTARLA